MGTMLPSLCGPQPWSQGESRAASGGPGVAGIVERSMRSLGMAVHALACATITCVPVAASSSPNALPMATRKWGSAVPAFSHRAWAATSGRSRATALATAGMA
eukprot:9407548-Lingulodinium_polyedra.AAC.1